MGGDGKTLMTAATATGTPLSLSSSAKLNAVPVPSSSSSSSTMPLSSLLSSSSSSNHTTSNNTSSSLSSSSSSSIATSALLREISTLRNRVKELEGGGSNEDSNAHANLGGESAVLVSVRKDLAKVEHEKAQQEQDFMNQLSAIAQENRNVVAQLEAKLEDAIQAAQKTAQKAANAANNNNNNNNTATPSNDRNRPNKSDNDDSNHAQEMEELQQLLEYERSQHQMEIHQLKTTLASSDEEIADLRRDMDHIHGQLDEVVMDKDELEHQLYDVECLINEEKELNVMLREQLRVSDADRTSLQEQVLQKDALIEKHVQEVGDLNDHVIQLQNHKAMLMEEITDMRMDWSKQQQQLQQGNSKKITPLQQQSSDSELSLLKEKLAEREKTIDSLTSRLNSTTSTEDWMSKNPQSPPSVSRITSSSSSSSSSTTSSSHSTHDRDSSPSPPPPTLTASTSSSSSRNRSRSRSRSRNHNSPKSSTRSLMSTTANANDTASSQENTVVLEELKAQLQEQEEQVADLTLQLQAEVAAHEELEILLRNEREHSRKLRSDLDTISNNNNNSNTSHSLLRNSNNQFYNPRKEMKAAMNMNQLLKQEQTLVKELRAELAESASRQETDELTIAELQNQLEQEQEAMEILKAELVAALAQDHDDLAVQLRDSQDEIDRLRTEIQTYEAEKVGFLEKARKSQAELAKLRMKTRQVSAEKKDMESKMLRGEFLNNSTPNQDEKKEESPPKYDEEIISELREQVDKLTTELASAHSEIDHLQAEVDRLQSDLKKEQGELWELQSKSADSSSLGKLARKNYESRINQLQVEVTKAQVSKDELEKEFTNRCHDLENELQALEVETEQELERRSAEIVELKEKLAQEEDLVAQLQSEHSQLCHSMNDVSSSRHDDMEEIQTELMTLTSKTKSQAREIQSLKIQIDEHVSRKQDVKTKYEEQIRILEKEVATVKAELRKHQDQEIDQEEIESIKAENADLRDSIRLVQNERRSLKDKLDAALSSPLSSDNNRMSSKSVQALRDRNVALKEEVEKLTKRLKKMEASITRFAI